jgi:hypothetical protein
MEILGTTSPESVPNSLPTPQATPRRHQKPGLAMVFLSCSGSTFTHSPPLWNPQVEMSKSRALCVCRQTAIDSWKASERRIENSVPGIL